MADLLKNIYNYESLCEIASRFKAVDRFFKDEAFVSNIINQTWTELPLKARIRKIAIILGQYLPSDYQKSLAIIDEVIANYPKGFNNFSLLYFPDFVEVYGQKPHNWKLSIAALERFTKSSSSEFAVRVFIINDEKRMMQQMMTWSRSNDEHVRRLASEGCRPQLPWAKALNNFKKDPTLILPILEQLKADSSLYVRKSIANNLNDISKTHPNLIIEITKKWYGKNKNTDWICKRACRTLLKNGHRQVLDIFGFRDEKDVVISQLNSIHKTIYIGENLTFSFKITTKKTSQLRIEYRISHVKANGKSHQKIFQISETTLEENTEKIYKKKHSLANFSSRKHFLGINTITLIVNGISRGFIKFEILG